MSSTVELFLSETWVLRPAVMKLAKGARLRRRPLQEQGNPRGRGKPRPYNWERPVLVWSFNLGFGDFFGDLGGSGELGTVPAAA